MLEQYLFKDIKTCETDFINTTEYEKVKECGRLDYYVEQCTMLVNELDDDNTYKHFEKDLRKII